MVVGEEGFDPGGVPHPTHHAARMTDNHFSLFQNDESLLIEQAF
ncbi:hypothetical protein [Enterovibrio nigricans]|uniref:Uncharacterized protein n=1 Tax=Enterovibrio nigricans DSM 22720 TaxID=1121868 RepID=A0A1T4U4C0_9GAMM|nr:hypothetical protein [Enterovibrio nigricans]SKA47378.1 hypothetical protein SAMN02745132_00718 [Enterovibrio nigricans DSM 22720]